MLAPVLFLFSVTAGFQPETIEVRQVLTLEPVGTGGRVPIVTNALTALLVKGEFKSPKEGDTVQAVGGAVRTWTKAEAGQDGTIQSRAFRGGFAFASVDSDADRVMMLEAAGHGYVYVNGEPRGGDPYSFGYDRVPILLHKGANSLLFNVGRGSLKARFVKPEGDVFIEQRDATLPDVIVGEGGELFGAVIVTNATDKTVSDLQVSAKLDGGDERSSGCAPLAPLTSQKVQFALRPGEKSEPGKEKLTLQLVRRGSNAPVGEPVTFDLNVKAPWDLHKRTFVSGIDGSVQYYAVLPPFKADLQTADSLILTVHGAGVEATGQAAAYGAKPWAWVVAATNRRPYGFDWEDWGRMDALEVLADAKSRFHPREDRIYLTGHSMGGHGAWILGAIYPDQWAAIGPCSGWISFSTYGGGLKYENPDAVEAMMLRAANVSDTTLLLRNYLQYGVYMVHGDKDDNVPVTEERKMREYLGAFHRDFDWHEEPGAGHWYDSDPAPGASCLDYGPMMDFFQRHRRTLSNEARHIEFTTLSPAVSSRCDWVEVEQQEVALMPSTIVATNPVGTNRFEVQTTNVQEFTVVPHWSPIPDPKASIELNVDGQSLVVSRVVDTFEKSQGKWTAVPMQQSRDKSPKESGPFKEAFNHNFTLVYGTTGTPEENAWSYAKARYDAETWWMRGNGSARIAPDTYYRYGEFETSVIAYGNEDTNALIKAECGSGPVRIMRGAVKIGEKTLKGDDLSMLCVRPRGLGVRLIAIVGGTGIVGMRSTDTMPYFVSGVHYPDLFVYDSRIHTIGSKAVRVAGYFGNDWSVEKGDFAWRD